MFLQLANEIKHNNQIHHQHTDAKDRDSFDDFIQIGREQETRGDHRQLLFLVSLSMIAHHIFP